MLFIVVVDVISRIAQGNSPQVADSEADLQERLVDWKEIFGKHGLRVSLEKTGVLCVERNEEIV